VDDRQADSGLSPGGSKESVSESHQAQLTTSETNDEEATQTLTIPSNGSSPRKIEANRRNAKKSTGPKTSPGKAMSSWDSARHGLLSERLPLIYGKNKRHFARLLTSLRQDLEPVGTVEEVLVERIAQEYWRLAVAAWHEGEELWGSSPFSHTSIDRIVRYQTTINRQLYQAINQLERLQRLRKGDHVPAPVNLQVLHDAPTISDEENPER
jgi:hypothetical protein